MACQLDTVISFTRSLTSVTGRIKLIKMNYRPDDIDDLEQQINVLLRDSAKKLQDTNNRCHQAEHDDKANEGDSDLLTMSSPPSTLCDPATNTQPFSSSSIQLTLALLPKAHPDPYYSSNQGDKSWASIPGIP